MYLSENLYEDIAKNGWNITLLTPSPTRNVNNKIRNQYKKKRIEIKYDDKLKIIRLPLFRENKSTLLRFLRYLVMTIQFFIKGFTIPADVYFAFSTPPILGFMIGFLSRIKKVPFVYSLQDIFPDSMVHAGITEKNSIVFKIGRIIENFTYRNADKIIVISEDFKKNLQKKKVPESKIEVIYNWVDETAIIPVERTKNTLFDEFNLPRDLFYVVYAGNLGKAQNIEIILKAAKNLESNKKIQFVVFGAGQDESFYKEMASSLQLENLVFFPLQPYELVSEVYSLGDVSIVACKKGHGGSAMPSKTWSIMSAGTTVIASFDESTDLQRIIEDNKLGIFTKADDSEALKHALLKLYNNTQICDELGINGRNYIENNLSRVLCVKKYLKVFCTL